MAYEIPGGSSITGTGRLASGVDGSAYGSPSGVTGATGNVTGYGSGTQLGSTLLTPSIQTIWSKEILFQAMPVLRFEQFAVKKTELGVMPGLQVNFMRYNNLPVPSGPLVEGIRMKTYGITAQQYKITVAEQGFAVAVSELLLNASFDDVMASASRLLGRNMAMYMDTQARRTLQTSSSVVNGYQPAVNVSSVPYGIYNKGNQAADFTTLLAAAGGPFQFTPAAVKDAVLELSTKNIPRLGETYVCFIAPAQSRQLRDHPEFIEVTKYAAPGNFMLGEIGRLYDVVFIETTQIGTVANTPGTVNGTSGAYTGNYSMNYADGNPVDWRPSDSSTGGVANANPYDAPLTVQGSVNSGLPGSYDSAASSGASPGVTNTPGWDQKWPNPYPAKGGTTQADVFEALMIGDNSFGHAISLPVELRDGGVLDFGREHALAWYSIWGFGLVTDSAVVKIRTNI